MSPAPITIALLNGPLDTQPWPGVTPESSGAIVSFEGVVRPTEDGLTLQALRYEAYEPMTSRELSKLAADVVQAHGLHRLDVQHSVGHVPAGQASFRLRVASAHRKEALAAMEWFIDRMKRDVPLWKVPVWSDSA